MIQGAKVTTLIISTKRKAKGYSITYDGSSGIKIKEKEEEGRAFLTYNNSLPRKWLHISC